LLERRYRLREHRQWLYRFAGALALSLGIHVLLVIGVQGRVPARRATAAPVLEARLAPATQIAVQTVITPLPAPRTAPVKALISLHQTEPASLLAGTAKQEVPASFDDTSAPSNGATAPVVPLPFDSVYYSAKQLDVLPKPLGDPRPPYPSDGAGNIAGRVVLQVMIDETGTVTDVAVEQSEPKGEFDAVCVAHYRTLHFQPGMKDGRPARSKARFELTFNAEASER
jgi:TonB family protein